MGESNKNPDLMKWWWKSSAMCFLSVINIKGHGQLWGGGFILQVFNRYPELLGVRSTETELLLYSVIAVSLSMRVPSLSPNAILEVE
jgi:hypothetical protein